MAAQAARAQARDQSSPRARQYNRAPRARGWCFTINNYTVEDEAQLERAWADGKLMYLVYGRETAPQTGTRHLQGYVYFLHPISMAGAKLRLSQRAHFEAAKGSPLQASTYCKKESDFEEMGELPRQGKRTDLLAMYEQMESGARVIDLLREGHLSGAQALTTAERLSKYVAAPERPDIKAVWLWGDTGLGKTRFFHDLVAHHKIPLSDVATCSFTSRQLDYAGQRACLLDEADGIDLWWLKFLLTFLDRYPLSIRVLYGHQAVCAELIVITSHGNPEDLLEAQLLSSRWPELRRRLLDVLEVREDFWGSSRHLELRDRMALPPAALPAAPSVSSPHPPPSSESPRSDLAVASGPSRSRIPRFTLDGLSPQTSFQTTSTTTLRDLSTAIRTTTLPTPAETPALS